jgi:pentapeptide MXKDX repeat protein
MRNRFLLTTSATVLALGLAATPSAFAQQSTGSTPQSSSGTQRSIDQGMQHPGEMASDSMSKNGGMQHGAKQNDTMKGDTMMKDPSKHDKGM